MMFGVVGPTIASGDGPECRHRQWILLCYENFVETTPGRPTSGSADEAEEEAGGCMSRSYIRQLHHAMYQSRFGTYTSRSYLRYSAMGRFNSAYPLLGLFDGVRAPIGSKNSLTIVFCLIDEM